MSEKAFSMPIRVFIEDTDAIGVVYYVNYLKYMERARTELLRSKGVPKPAILAEGMCLVVVSATVDYKKPARLDESLEATASVKKMGFSYVIFEQKIMRNGDCLCKGEVKIACVDQATMKPCAFPKRCRDILVVSP